MNSLSQYGFDSRSKSHTYLFSSISLVMVAAADSHCLWASRATCSAAAARSSDALRRMAQLPSIPRSWFTSVLNEEFFCVNEEAFFCVKSQ